MSTNVTLKQTSFVTAHYRPSLTGCFTHANTPKSAQHPPQRPGGHMSLLVPVPTPGLLSINSPPSVQTPWHGVNTQSPRESDRMAQEADLLPKLPIALPATLAFPGGWRIKPQHSQGPGTGTAQPPPLTSSTRFVFTSWCQEIRNRQYLRKSSQPITCSAAAIPPPASPCRGCGKP